MKLGVLLNNLSPGQLAARFLTQANTLVATGEHDVVAFYEALRRPCVAPNFASMHVVEGYGFDGPMVATTASTAEKLARFPSCPRKVFYVWDLEWLRPHLAAGRTYRDWLAVYGNKDLTLLARSEDHAAALRGCWNRDVTVVPDFDLAGVVEACR
jgi:hypothetical protein